MTAEAHIGKSGGTSRRVRIIDPIIIRTQNRRGGGEARAAEVLATGRRREKRMAKCRPHKWKWPEVGDDGLVCEQCGRFIDYFTEMTDELGGRILSNRYLQGRTIEFVQAKVAAHADATRRALLKLRAEPRDLGPMPDHPERVGPKLRAGPSATGPLEDHPERVGPKLRAR